MREKVANLEKMSPNNENLSQKNDKITFKYNCMLCNYSTNKLGDFKKHENSNKHILKYEKEKEINIKKEKEKSLQQKNDELQNELNSLKSKYKTTKNENEKLKTKLETTIENNRILKEENNLLLLKIDKLTEDKEKIRDKHEDQLVHIIENTKPNKTYNTNCNNKNLDINIILNTEHKDAINLSDLIENIKNNTSLDDIENEVNAMTKIKEALNSLQPKERPFVCENPCKRLLYFKDDNQWLLDNEVKKARKFLSDMGTYMQLLVVEWRKNNEYGPKNEDKKSLKYLKLRKEVDPCKFIKGKPNYDEAIKELCRISDIKYLK
jgi:hypothetical protein